VWKVPGAAFDPFGDIERAPLESFSTTGTDIQALFRSLHSVDDLSG
jgi:hypothetical protein